MKRFVLLWTVLLVGFVPNTAFAQVLPPLPQPKPPVVNPLPPGDIINDGVPIEGTPPGGGSPGLNTPDTRTVVVKETVREEITQERLNASYQTGSQFIAIGFVLFFGSAIEDINRHFKAAMGDLLHSPKELMGAVKVDELYKQMVYLAASLLGLVFVVLGILYLFGPIVGLVDKKKAMRWLRFWVKTSALVFGVGVAILFAMELSDAIVDYIIKITKSGSTDVFFSTKVVAPVGESGKGSFLLSFLTVCANGVCLIMLFLINVAIVVGRLIAPPLMVGYNFKPTRWIPLLWASVFGVLLLQKPILALIFSIADTLVSYYKGKGDEFGAMGVIIITMLLAVMVPGLVLYFGITYAIRNAIPALVIGRLTRAYQTARTRIPRRMRTGSVPSPAI